MRVNWNELEEYTVELAKKIKESNENFDSIVAIATSGLPTALLLSKILNIKDVFFIRIATYGNDIVDSYLPNLEGRTVLIVDDIVSSGKTMEIAKGLVYKKSPESIKTSASVVSARVCKTYPDFYGTALMREENDWISFPWDEYEK